MEEDRRSRSRKDKGGMHKASEVDPRGNAEEEIEDSLLEANTPLEYRNTPV